MPEGGAFLASSSGEDVMLLSPQPRLGVRRPGEGTWPAGVGQECMQEGFPQEVQLQLSPGGAGPTDRWEGVPGPGTTQASAGGRKHMGCSGRGAHTVGLGSVQAESDRYWPDTRAGGVLYRGRCLELQAHREERKTLSGFYYFLSLCRKCIPLLSVPRLTVPLLLPLPSPTSPAQQG